MVLISTLTQKGQVTIPLIIRQALGLKPRERVVFLKEDGRVYLKPAVNFLDLAGSIKTSRPFNIGAMRKSAKDLVGKRHGQGR
ncbi:AbrB/MazE/SpoVT family DNA-binding domain-containing protein [Candidatus Gottesmanbacteria bacterium]|nr:AbrB/MazE/SpoVT family DNA-binding domain-containing protein [Candidatus Gottesmanbacteria bacterium]MBI5465043.1 AbrB/MazE/SpoVT family DNA-binding domain-containing protein [Candidatus Gottesmanbacteria bacterium]